MNERICHLAERVAYLRGHPGYRRNPSVALFRLAAWRVHCALGVPGVAELSAWDLRLRLPARWKGISKLLYAFREQYELELGFLPNLLSPCGTFVDIGACFGVYSLVAARLVRGDGCVLAFEPAQESFAVLESNVRLNALGNVKARRAALTDRPGDLPLFHFADASRNSLGWNKSSNGSERVAASTLDMEIDGEGQIRVDVVKIDAEGAEELVLRGASATLRQARPVVIFECNPDAAANLALNQRGAWNLLKQHGYAFWCVGSDGNLHKLPSPAPGNIIAIHRNS